MPVFFVGVFLANLLKYKTGDLCRILNIWILEQFAYSSISPERLFCSCFGNGESSHFFLFVWGRMRICGGIDGMVVSSDRNIWIFSCNGDCGSWNPWCCSCVCRSASTGHFYVAAVLWCRFCGKNSRQYRPPVCNPKIRIKQAVESVVFYGVAVILVIGGVFAEAYINIPLLKMIVKIF